MGAQARKKYNHSGRQQKRKGLYGNNFFGSGILSQGESCFLDRKSYAHKELKGFFFVLKVLKLKGWLFKFQTSPLLFIPFLRISKFFQFRRYRRVVGQFFQRVDAQMFQQAQGRLICITSILASLSFLFLSIPRPKDFSR